MDVAEPMNEGEIWKPLLAELDRWDRSGKQAFFWLRDDDAVVPTAELAHLLGLAGQFAVPLTLAVIPKETDQALARCLDDTPGVSVAVHGWSHQNHAPIGEKKRELGLHRPMAAILAELRTGFAHLADLHGDRFCAMLVPPWNRIDPRLLPHLSKAGFCGLSTFGPETASPIPLLNTHVDLIDWKSTRRARDTAVLVADIVGQLRQVNDTGGAVGILSHHLVHDAAAWRFLETLFGLISEHPGCNWGSVTELMPGPVRHQSG